MKSITKKELLHKLKSLGDISEDQRNEITCSLIGHSRIVSTCFGYVNCGRCDEQIGDTLMGFGSTSKNVVIGHKCPLCIKNFALCTWKDKLFTQDPFEAE